MWSVDGSNGGHLQMLAKEMTDKDAENAALEACSGQLMSHNTYDNIVKNKGNIDYCIEQFGFIENRIRCMKVMCGGGPFLA